MSIWSPTRLGSGFLIEGRGLIAKISASSAARGRSKSNCPRPKRWQERRDFVGRPEGDRVGTSGETRLRGWRTAACGKGQGLRHLYADSRCEEHDVGNREPRHRTRDPLECADGRRQPGRAAVQRAGEVIAITTPEEDTSSWDDFAPYRAAAPQGRAFNAGAIAGASRLAFGGSSPGRFPPHRSGRRGNSSISPHSTMPPRKMD